MQTPNYKAIYFKLFGAISGVVDLLQEASLEAEKIVMEGGGSPVSLSGEQAREQDTDEG